MKWRLDYRSDCGVRDELCHPLVPATRGRYISRRSDVIYAIFYLPVPYHHKADLMGFPPVFTSNLHRLGILMMRARILNILILCYFS